MIRDFPCVPAPWNKLTRGGLSCLLKANVPSMPILREIVRHSWLCPFARWYSGSVKKALAACEPAASMSGGLNPGAAPYVAGCAMPARGGRLE